MTAAAAWRSAAAQLCCVNANYKNIHLKSESRVFMRDLVECNYTKRSESVYETILCGANQ